MDHLWSPWRYRYIQSADADATCIFCQKAAEHKDEQNLIVFRGARNFVILNLFPYTTGHLMVAPYEHVDTLDRADEATTAEMMLLMRAAQTHLGSIYNAHGFNLGMNLGVAAGAGIAGHIHMHVLPRWRGDANFMSVIGETRVMPEELGETYRKLKAAWVQVGSSM
ncbi:MAG: HIT domain-containing protein [Acidobacteriota bacterium]|nr:HIT domain-containing protein [Acidobacteriota bacterium]